jgi:hypothetical protein
MITKNLGIFIKTCAKDHEWLKWCLLSIQQNCSNFAGVCIVTDNDHKHIQEYDEIIKQIGGTVVHLEAPTNNHTCQDGIGYLWMQNIKLNWHEFCKYDNVLQIDSDCIIFPFMNAKYWIDGARYKWFVRDWGISKSGLVHKKPLQKLLRYNPKYEHMPYNGWILTRTDTENFHKWIADKHKCTWWNYLLNHTKDDWGKNVTDENLKLCNYRGLSRGSSIYNAYGGFLELIQSQNYHFISITEQAQHLHPVQQYWSWGGLSGNIKEQIIILLNQSNFGSNDILSLDEFIEFDDSFYIVQNPQAYHCLNYMPDSMSNKEKLFYHYKIFNNNCLAYLNSEIYENTIFGKLDIDEDFDHIFYANKYPETQEYFCSLQYPVSLRKKLYHHYINYGKNKNPPFYKNSLQLAIDLTKIEETIPSWFNAHQYESICPEVKDYCMPYWSNIPIIYRYYHHYINYGQHNHHIFKKD